VTEPAVEIRGLTKRYGERAAVQDVSFSVMPGTVTGLVGRNGAGKTTTLKALVGILRPTAGTARVPALERAPQSPARALGFVLDPPGIDPGHRARRHLEIAAVMAGVPRSRVDEVIVDYGIEDCARQRARSLSTGQRQRLALATAQLGEPEVLVLDEPTNGLDADGVRWLRRELRAHADAGGAVLISSHMLAELQQIADEVVVLEREVLFRGTLDELTGGGDRTLEDAYFDLVEPVTERRELSGTTAAS
jgi:ABC-2 type transport system ATP-binding protein